MKLLKIWIISIISILILTAVAWYGLTFFWQQKTKSIYHEFASEKKKKYAYYLFNSSLDQTMYAQTPDDGQKLVEYYNKLNSFYESNDLNEIKFNSYISPLTGDSLFEIPIVIPIAVRYLKITQEVYIKKIINDSLTNVIIFNTDCWGYFDAYIPTQNIHDFPPSDSLLIAFKKFINSMPSKADYNYGTPSPFGFYCN